MLLDCSRILDHVVEPGAHLWQGIPGVPRDLVGVVAERQSDALLVGSVLVRVNANPRCSSSPCRCGLQREPVLQDAEKVLVLVLDLCVFCLLGRLAKNKKIGQHLSRDY